MPSNSIDAISGIALGMTAVGLVMTTVFMTTQMGNEVMRFAVNEASALAVGSAENEVMALNGNLKPIPITHLYMIMEKCRGELDLVRSVDEATYAQTSLHPDDYPTSRIYMYNNLTSYNWTADPENRKMNVIIGYDEYNNPLMELQRGIEVTKRDDLLALFHKQVYVKVVQDPDKDEFVVLIKEVPE